MKILGPRLHGPKIAAIILSIYAGCYGALLLVLVGVGPEVSIFFSAMLGLIGLAVTPFIALAQLNRVIDPESETPVRAIVMAIVMALPAIFWLYVAFDTITPLRFARTGDVAGIIGLFVVPGFLALWLSVTFGLLALNERQINDADAPPRTADIE